jgi:hypothetical protein
MQWSYVDYEVSFFPNAGFSLSLSLSLSRYVLSIACNFALTFSIVVKRDGITEKNPRWWNSFVKLKQDNKIC